MFAEDAEIHGQQAGAEQVEESARPVRQLRDKKESFSQDRLARDERCRQFLQTLLHPLVPRVVRSE